MRFGEILEIRGSEYRAHLAARKTAWQSREEQMVQNSTYYPHRGG